MKRTGSRGIGSNTSKTGRAIAGGGLQLLSEEMEHLSSSITKEVFPEFLLTESFLLKKLILGMLFS